VVYVDGTVWGLRDATLIRMFDEGRLPDADLVGSLLLHTAPSVRKLEGSHGSGRPRAGVYEPISVGTTTSMRMDRFTGGCLELGARAIIGKGGLSKKSGRLLARAGAVYLSLVGGAASPETLQVESIEDVLFEDLLPECLWKFRVSGLGPLFVSMDSTGESLYEQTSLRVSEHLAAAERVLGISR
jgi:L(+)-tartrate dehydratase beta subunit